MGACASTNADGIRKNSPKIQYLAKRKHRAEAAARWLEAGNSNSKYVEPQEHLCLGLTSTTKLIYHYVTRDFAVGKSYPATVAGAYKARHELKVLAAVDKVRSPFTPACFGGLISREQAHIVMEFVPGGPLSTHFPRLPGRSIPASLCTGLLAEIACGLDAIHSAGVIYRSLCRDHILLDTLGHVRLVDYSDSVLRGRQSEPAAASGCPIQKQLHQLPAYHVCPGKQKESPSYRADRKIRPSYHRAKAAWTISGPAAGASRASSEPAQEQHAPWLDSIDTSTDWWAFGALACEIITGSTPFGSMSSASTVLYAAAAYGRFRWPAGIPSDAKELVLACMHPNPDKRPRRLGELKHLRYFKGIDWELAARGGLTLAFVPRVTHPADTSHFPPASDPLAAVREQAGSAESARNVRRGSALALGAMQGAGARQRAFVGDASQFVTKPGPGGGGGAGAVLPSGSGGWAVGATGRRRAPYGTKRSVVADVQRAAGEMSEQDRTTVAHLLRAFH